MTTTMMVIRFFMALPPFEGDLGIGAEGRLEHALYVLLDVFLRLVVQSVADRLGLTLLHALLHEGIDVLDVNGVEDVVILLKYPRRVLVGCV